MSENFQDHAAPISDRDGAGAQREVPDRAAFAQLAGGLAPVFNDLLTVITGRAALLLDHAGADAAMQESLRQIYTAGERAACLIRQLQIISGRECLQPEKLDLNRLIEEHSGTLRRVLGADVEMELKLGADLPPLSADAGLLEQVLVITALNARDAMPDGGRFTISTALVTVTADEAKSPWGGRAGRHLVLGLADTGAGMSGDHLARVGEPFFSTKSEGRGAGLGLAALLSIARQHGGWATAHSEPDAGAEFRVFLPVGPDEGPDMRPAPNREQASVRGTVLVVEDEPSVREFTAAMLTRQGYRVLQAASVTDALETWKWHQARIALLLTDLVLEDNITGLELAQMLREEKPDLRVICVSGHELLRQSATAVSGCVLLEKPYRPQALLRAVHELLAPPP